MRPITEHCTSLLQKLLYVLFFAATSLSQTFPPVVVQPVAPANGSSVHDSKLDPVPQPGGDSAVRLGIGDLIEVSVYDVPELNTKTRVGDSGNIYLPLVDYVHVAGLTINEAETAIEKRLDQGGFVKNPHVQLFVQEYTSAGASLLGEIAHPGVYPVLGEQKLFSLISAAGGLSERAGKSITLDRKDQPPTTITISRNLDDHPESNIPVFPGDTIIVRRADVVYVVGEVTRPSGFLMDSGHVSVLQAVALAGGASPNAKLSGARIIRKGPSGLSEVPVPLKKLLQAKAEDIPMQPDDILFVPTSSRKLLTDRTAQAVLQMATTASLVAIRP
jgi:polysaccharide export outer membrane protein